VLAPSYFGRPYNSLSKVGDVQMICYPIADSALGAADRVAPPAATVRLYRALGDSSRLRILRLLAERDRYLTEIANELELSKPTIKHHLALLRAAGLVTLTDQGNLTYYSLRHDRAEEAGVELRAYLAH
jgi:DNA-binding transcriptional ArsR family regulator